jgi:hypothetical protein
MMELAEVSVFLWRPAKATLEVIITAKVITMERIPHVFVEKDLTN